MFLFKILITFVLTVSWWRFKRYLKEQLFSSIRANHWTYRLRFTDKSLGRGKLKIKNSVKKGLLISFEADNLNTGEYDTISVMINGKSVMDIGSNSVLNGKSKVNDSLVIEPVDGDQVAVIVDDAVVANSIFKLKD